MLLLLYVSRSSVYVDLIESLNVTLQDSLLLTSIMEGQQGMAGLTGKKTCALVLNAKVN